jgi:hypothetical protein
MPSRRMPLGVFLICINNRVALDGQQYNLGFIVHDYYKACVQ